MSEAEYKKRMKEYIANVISNNISSIKSLCFRNNSLYFGPACLYVGKGIFFDFAVKNRQFDEADVKGLLDILNFAKKQSKEEMLKKEAQAYIDILNRLIQKQDYSPSAFGDELGDGVKKYSRACQNQSSRGNNGKYDCILSFVLFNTIFGDDMLRQMPKEMQDSLEKAGTI